MAAFCSLQAFRHTELATLAFNRVVFRALPASAELCPLCPANESHHTTNWRRYAAGGLSCMIVSAILHPIDTIKTRLQTQNELMTTSSYQRRYHGFFHALQRIAVEEGPRGFFRGITASMMREASYSSIRMGLYEPARYLLAPDAEGDIGLTKKILAGLISGGVGSALANPTDLVKIRFQGHLPDQPVRYTSTWNAFASIYKAEGVFKGLWRGTVPTTLRAAVLTGSQLSSYDHSKHLLRRYDIMNDGVPLHLTAALISGLVTSTASSPVDVIKTRWMNARPGTYKGPLDCFLRTVRSEGLRGLYRGWLPNYLRLGPHFLMSLPMFEYFRHLFGVGYLK